MDRGYLHPPGLTEGWPHHMPLEGLQGYGEGDSTICLDYYIKLNLGGMHSVTHKDVTKDGCAERDRERREDGREREREREV